jgi:hypothetical protein
MWYARGVNELEMTSPGHRHPPGNNAESFDCELRGKPLEMVRSLPGATQIRSVSGSICRWCDRRATAGYSEGVHIEQHVAPLAEGLRGIPSPHQNCLEKSSRAQHWHVVALQVVCDITYKWI